MLGRVINQTNQGVINAFTIQDGNLHVQRRVFNDMAKDLLKDGCEGTLKLQDDGNIDWQWYFNEYELAKVAVALMMWINKMMGAPEPEQEKEDEQDFVFGGDYAHSHDAES